MYTRSYIQFLKSNPYRKSTRKVCPDPGTIKRKQIFSLTKMKDSRWHTRTHTQSPVTILSLWSVGSTTLSPGSLLIHQIQAI